MSAAQDVGWALHEIRPGGAVTVERVIEITAAAFALRPLELLANNRKCRAAVIARQVVAYVARRKTIASYTEIGRALSRDHTTIMTAERVVARKVLTDERLARIVDRVMLETEGE